jgi:hypothetical protein
MAIRVKARLKDNLLQIWRLIGNFSHKFWRILWRCIELESSHALLWRANGKEHRIRVKCILLRHLINTLHKLLRHLVLGPCF